MTVLLSTGFLACSNGGVKKESPTTQAETTGNAKITVTDEMYTCEMHNEVISDKGGKCPKCGMTLVKQKMTDAQKKMLKEGTYIKP